MISPGIALALGLGLSFFVPKRPALNQGIKQWSTRILQASVVLLGANLSFQSLLTEGQSSFWMTAFQLSITGIAGYLFYKIFKLDSVLAALITFGTGICGGSAIAALGPVLRADSTTLGSSLAVVFLLNAVGLWVFPGLGHFFQLSPSEFGQWAALAIHDTSSVVGAAAAFHPDSLATATTVKLTRALWIFPITLLVAVIINWRNRAKIGTKQSPPFPWFILGFVGMSVTLGSLSAPWIVEIRPTLVWVAKTGFAGSLFLVGLNLDWKKLRGLGLKPLFFGVGLWALATTLSFWIVRSN